jgi:hypothetical protein
MPTVPLKEGFTQVVVWPGTVLEAEQVPEFEQWMMDEFRTRAQYLETILTAPTMRNGAPVEGTGGRSDLFFAIHTEDIANLAISRFEFGMRWVEDVIAEINGGCALWPERVKEYCSWDANCGVMSPVVFDHNDVVGDH